MLPAAFRNISKCNSSSIRSKNSLGKVSFFRYSENIEWEYISTPITPKFLKETKLSALNKAVLNFKDSNEVMHVKFASYQGETEEQKQSDYFDINEFSNEIEKGKLKNISASDIKGFIFLRGRAKNVIVLKNGKNIYPEEVETLISGLPYVKESLVFGKPRHKDGDAKDLILCAKIVYDKDYFKSDFGALDRDKIQHIIENDIDKLSDSLPSYKRIHRISVTDKEMIKTTTGKVKRYVEQ